MNEEQVDFLEKLVRLEKEASKLADALPSGMYKTHAEHVALVARLLKARFDVFAPVILPPTKGKGEQR